jgi:acyl carrier protein
VDRREIFAEIVAIVRLIDTSGDPRAIRFDDTPFKAYGLSSLTQIRLIALVEDRFDIAITDVDALAAYSPLKFVELIERKVSQVGSTLP